MEGQGVLNAVFDPLLNTLRVTGVIGGPTVDVTKVNGTTPDTNSGTKSAGTLRVVIATDQPALTTPMPTTANASTVPAATTMQNSVAVNAFGTYLNVQGYATALINIVSSPAMSGGTTVNFEASVDDTTWVAIAGHQIGVNGSLATTTTADGDFRFAVAGYKSLRARINGYSAGTVTVKGYLAVTASPPAASVSQAPVTSGGLSVYHLVSANTTNATVVKNAAGQLYGYYIYNSNAAARKLVFHNASTTPTAGASVFFSIVIPPTSAANVEFNNGIAFSTGISITTVTELTDAGATAVAASDLIINLFYK